MAKEGNPVIGHVECPHCGNQATVHREKLGQRAMYYRCYGGEWGDCGTVQVRGAAGQRWLKKQAVLFGHKSGPSDENPKANEELAEAENQGEQEAEENVSADQITTSNTIGVKPRSSLLTKFLEIEL